MDKFVSLIILLVFSSSSAMASEGFTWISLFKKDLGLPEHVITYFFVVITIIILGLIYNKKVKKLKNPLIPDNNVTLRNLIDMYGKFIFSQASMIMGEHRAKQYFSFIATIFIVILLSNLIGLVPGFLPPTEHISTTLALGIFSFVFYNYKGIRANGIIGYFKHFAGPLWYMAFLIFPIELISHLFRPLTLALRLRGNIMGDHMVLSTFYNLAPIGIPVFFLFFGILVSIVQAYVFMTLSMVYISLATSHD